MDIESELENWRRWARTGQPKHPVSWLGKHYKPNPFEVGENGEIVQRTPIARMPIDDKAAEKLDKLILALPRKCKATAKRVDYPRLVVYHYVGHPGPGEFRRACRKIGIRVSEYEDRLQRAITMLHQALDGTYK